MPVFLTFIISWIVSLVLIFLSEVSLLQHDFSDGTVLCRDVLISWIIALVFALGRAVKGRTAFQLLPESEFRSTSADESYKQYPGGPANHFNAGTADEGHLYFFPDSLVFHPHTKGPHRADVTIKYNNIADVKPSILNSIIVNTRDEKSHRFAVENKHQWVSDIKARIG